MRPFSARSTPAESEPPVHKLIRMFQSETAEIRELPGPVRARIAVTLIAAMFAALVLIACFYQVDRVVTSTFGQLVTSDPTIVVQALDPSIIKTIDVKEGERVKAGHVLATLDPTFAAADVNTLRLQLSSLKAEIARCEAELANRPFTYEGDDQPGGKQYAALQKAFFDQRKSQFDSQVEAYDELIAQNKATMARLKEDQNLYSYREKANKEIEDIRAAEAAHEWGSRLLLLQQTDLKLEVQRLLEADQNSLIETQHQLDATTATRAAFVQQWWAQTTQELINARNQRDSAQEQLDKAAKHQELVTLQAPEDAIVLRVADLSVGSILQQGQSFIELAPLRSPIEAEVYVMPRDVGFIRHGDNAVIKLDEYYYIEHGYLTGKVEWISAGTFTASQITTAGAIGAAGTSPGGSSALSSGSNPTSAPDTSLSQLNGPYYKARIRISKIELKDVPEDFTLTPGMTLEADVSVGTRSLFWYLMRGAARGVGESMREPK